MIRILLAIFLCVVLLPAIDRAPIDAEIVGDQVCVSALDAAVLYEAWRREPVYLDLITAYSNQAAAAGRQAAALQVVADTWMIECNNLKKNSVKKYFYVGFLSFAAGCVLTGFAAFLFNRPH